MDDNMVIQKIQEVARQVLPPGSELYLYGSRARGDARPDSDWDLLVLLDNPNVLLTTTTTIATRSRRWGSTSVPTSARTTIRKIGGTTVCTPCSFIM